MQGPASRHPVLGKICNGVHCASNRGADQTTICHSEEHSEEESDMQDRSSFVSETYTIALLHVILSEAKDLILTILTAAEESTCWMGV